MSGMDDYMVDPCFFSGRMGECSGRLDKHHVIKAQRIRRRFPFGAVVMEDGTVVPATRLTVRSDALTSLTSILRDRRNLKDACRFHHDNWHWSRFSFPYEDLPPEVIEFAEQYGLVSELERAYAPRQEAA